MMVGRRWIRASCLHAVRPWLSLRVRSRMADKIDCLILARPFVAHGRERDQSEILTDGVRVCIHEAADRLQKLFRRCRIRMTKLEIVGEYAAHEQEGRNNSHAATAGRTLRIWFQRGHAVWQHGLGTCGVLGERS
jgi:hypothetical protein